MKYWIVVNRQQCGPFELDQLETMQFNMSTPAWHEGLSEWIPAGEIAELREMLERRMAAGNAGDGQVEVTVETGGDTVYVAAADPQPAGAAMTDEYGMKRFDESKRPSSYLGWAIASTVLCCLPLGVLAIIFSASVNPKFERGDEEGARKASERAQWCIMLAISLGLALAPLQSVISML